MRLAAFLFALVLPVAASAASVNLPARPAPTPVDKLFERLAQASSPEEAKPIEEQIEALFLQSSSPTVDLLMARAAASEQTQDLETARKLLNSIVVLAPDYAEGWRRLGTLQALGGDDAGAMISLERAVFGSRNGRSSSASAPTATGTMTVNSPLRPKSVAGAYFNDWNIQRKYHSGRMPAGAGAKTSAL